VKNLILSVSFVGALFAAGAAGSARAQAPAPAQAKAPPPAAKDAPAPGAKKGAEVAPPAGKEPAKDAGKPAGKEGAAVPAALVDLNTATEDELKALPAVGDVYAAKIIAARPFARKDQLRSRKVVPPAVYNKIKNVVTAKQPDAKK
jgi:DNA uptake protein ComE-like DNA-binding protein